MKMTYMLEMSDAEPRQYRITVLVDTVHAIMQHALDHAHEGFSVMGYYDTVEDLMTTLAPYLAMEASK